MPPSISSSSPISSRSCCAAASASAMTSSVALSLGVMIESSSSSFFLASPAKLNLFLSECFEGVETALFAVRSAEALYALDPLQRPERRLLINDLLHQFLRRVTWRADSLRTFGPCCSIKDCSSDNSSRASSSSGLSSCSSLSGRCRYAGLFLGWLIARVEATFFLPFLATIVASPKKKAANDRRTDVSVSMCRASVLEVAKNCPSLSQSQLPFVLKRFSI
ncbi:hypothetical protein KCU85_g275, partial [Aureobasidium melanogenum]